MIHHLGRVAIAALLQAHSERFAIEALASVQQKALALQPLPGRQAVQQSAHRNDEAPLTVRCQATQGRNAFRNDVLEGTEAVVGQRFPIRQVQNLHFRREKWQFRIVLHGRRRIGAYQYGKSWVATHCLRDGD